MTQENVTMLWNDVSRLLTEEFGSWELIKFDPKPNEYTGTPGITLSIKVGSALAYTRKSTINEVIEEVKKQIGTSLPILEKHYL